MKTLIKKTGNTIVVSMDGKLDFETAVPLREDLNRLIRQTKTDTVATKIIFNLEKLDFVGSSGISSFVQALKDFNHGSAIKPKYCHVKTEFQKIIKAFDESEGFEFHENEERAKRSFDC